MTFWIEVGMGSFAIAIGGLVIVQSIISLRARLKAIKEVEKWKEWERKDDNENNENGKVA